MATKKIGEILLENNIITQAQLDEALRLQQTMFPDQPVGQVLCRLGYVSEADLAYILEQNGKRKKLLDILIQRKTVSAEQISQITAAINRGVSPSSAARSAGVPDEAVARAVATQYDLPYAHINAADLDAADLLKTINPSFAQRHGLVPVSKIGNTVTVAMATPVKFQDLKELERNLQIKVIPVIITEADLSSVRQALYNISSETQDISQIMTASAAEPDEVEEEVKGVSEQDSIIVKFVNRLIHDAYQAKASDIHIEPYPGKKDMIIRFRVDGQCFIYQKVPYKYKYALPSRLKIMASLDIAEKRKPQDGKIDFKKFAPIDLELRMATMPTAGGLEDVVLRLLSHGEPVSFDDLALSDYNYRVIDESFKKPYGLILVVGPTGSGKTTTLHSAIARINQPKVKIWTAEDPVEITQEGLRQVQVNPRIGFTFAAALRSFLRLDPDVIMVGEMRDLETASIALEASLTGHLVLSTLHTNSAPETVTRLLDMGLDPFSFSDSLLCIVAQRLARKLCPACKETYTPSAAEIDALREEYGGNLEIPANITLARPVGCPECSKSGYRGRMGIHEALLCDESIKALIRKRADAAAVRAMGLASGMTTLKQDGILKVLKGLTDIQEIRRVCLG